MIQWIKDADDDFFFVLTFFAYFDHGQLKFYKWMVSFGSYLGILLFFFFLESKYCLVTLVFKNFHIILIRHVALSVQDDLSCDSRRNRIQLTTVGSYQMGKSCFCIVYFYQEIRDLNSSFGNSNNFSEPTTTHHPIY